MFKIPSYQDLEKNEKEISEKGAQLKLSLFNCKRKEIEETKKLEIDVKATFNSASNDIKITSSKQQIPIAAADDDDDALLSNIDLDAVSSAKKVKTLDTPSVIQQVDTFKKPPPTSTTTTNSSSNMNKSNALLVNSKQRGNPILKYIRNVQWGYSDTLVPDYLLGRSSCALYLSMKYHLLNNEYIHERLKELGRAYELRVLLLIVDIKETKHCLKEIEKICLLANLTLILCWNYEEAGRYLETYKAYEYKNADLIQEKAIFSTNFNNANQIEKANNSNFIINYTEFLCEIKSINKTDASTLRQTFGSIKNLSEAGKSELSIVPGLGPSKVTRLYDIFRTPFLLNSNNNDK